MRDGVEQVVDGDVLSSCVSIGKDRFFFKVAKYLCNDSLSLLRYHFFNCVAVLSICLPD